MQAAVFPMASPTGGPTEPDIVAFYRRILEVLDASGLPFLIGGAYAFNCHTGIGRETRDLDIFIRRQDYPAIAQALQQAGYPTELTFPHWLAKVHADDTYIDLIFSSGNGVAEVDDIWFEQAPVTEVLGMPVKISPPEEMIWSKAFVMERERYDGADVAHLLMACGERLDWHRLLQRFGPHWRVLLSHLVLFGFIYPDRREKVPDWLMEDLLDRLRQEMRTASNEGSVCAGTLLSREQYLPDLEQQGYRDARLIPIGNMTSRDTDRWTDAISDRRD
jgi:hypothetical protein